MFLYISKEGGFYMKKVTWLHLSDLHIKKYNDDINGFGILIESLFDDIKHQIEKEKLKIDFIFVSGDISFSGSAEELSTAEKVLTKIASISKVNLENVFLVPGNHDIVRNRALKDCVSSYKFKGDFSNNLPNELSNVVLHSLKNYNSLANRLNKNAIDNPNSLFYEVKRKIAGKTISIIGLNTAWSAAEYTEPGQIILGEYQVRKSLQSAENSDVIIALMHHPFSWLSDSDNNISKDLLSKRTDFILTGHVHKVSDIGNLSIFGNAFCITTGAVYDELGNNGNSYNITTCDLETGTGKIYFRQYISSHGGFWSVDNTIDQSVPDGIVTFQLPSRIQVDNSEKQRLFKPSLPIQAAEKEHIENYPIPKIPKALIDDIKNGNCFLFAGAGASIDAGLPSWFELLSNGLDELDNRVVLPECEREELQKLLSDGKFLIVADYLRYRLGEQWFSQYIRKYLSTKGRRSARQEILSKLPFKIILTTNYDDFLEKYRSNSKVILPKNLIDEGYDCIVQVLDNEETPIVKLHGTYDNASSIVFGDTEYSKLLYRSEKYRNAVERLLSEKTCVFVGFGFSDVNILAFLQSIHETKGNKAPKHYSIMKRMGNVMERYFRDNLNVEPIYIEDFAQTDSILYFIEENI